LFRTSLFALLFSLFSGVVAHAQQTARLDFAVSYIAASPLQKNNNQNYYLQGGSAELGSAGWHGLGVALNVSGSHTASIGSTGTALSLVTTTFGPRYRWHAGHKVSIYGEGLIGEANGFGSLFPISGGGVQSDANGLATQIGGGIDVALRHHLAARIFEASWVRTQLPNGTSDAQNDLKLGAGIVLRFR
jgi:hypothetical protein